MQWRPLVWATVMLVSGAGLYVIDDVVFVFAALGLIFGAILVTALAWSPALLPTGWLRSFVALLAKLSFGMYLNHFGVLRWVVEPLHAVLRVGTANSSLIAGLSLAVTAFLSVALASLLYLLIEYPFLKWRGPVLRRLAARSTRTAVAGQ